MAKLIKSSGEVTDVFPTKGHKFSLKEMQTYVGGFIEFVATSDPLFVLCVNEDGLSMKLPKNPVASSMVSQYGLQALIVGDILIGTPKEFGYD